MRGVGDVGVQVFHIFEGENEGVGQALAFAFLADIGAGFVTEDARDFGWQCVEGFDHLVDLLLGEAVLELVEDYVF